MIMPATVDEERSRSARRMARADMAVAAAAFVCPRRVPFRPLPPRLPLPPSASMLYVWGRNSDGQCGELRDARPPATVALPHPLPLPHAVTSIACGTGQQGCTLAVLADGSLLALGNNAGCRLGHADPRALRTPRRVAALAGVHVTLACVSDAHALCLSADGAVYSWGHPRRSGCLGRAAPADAASPPAVVPLPRRAVAVDCESGYSAALLADGALFVWGKDAHGRLGLGAAARGEVVGAPTAVPMPEGCGGVAAVSLGSLYAACLCTRRGEARPAVLCTWGYGGHGNLGHGDRRDRDVPTRVEGEAGGAFAAEEWLAAVACTRGQEGVKGGLYPRRGGAEGPHTMAVGGSGQLYTFGTCHKGVLANLSGKTGGFGDDFDELRPYAVGVGPPRNKGGGPLSPFGCWPPQQYAREPGPLVAVASGHIHAAALGADGRLWTWGCGSNDGRCGVERFLNMAGEGKPPRVDAMKCYMMGPHRCGVARKEYWPHGPSLDGVRVTAIATGRNHMACIGIPGEGLPASVVNQSEAFSRKADRLPK